MQYGLIGEKLSHSFSKIIHESLADDDYALVELGREQLADFRELADRVGLKQGLQQFAVGALMGTCLILVCCAAEWLESLCN